METVLRPEEAKDDKIVENVTREAFWNVHFPGANEHLLAHKLRSTKEFIGELDLAAVYNGEIVGSLEGLFDEGSAYEIDENKLNKFDREFSPKEKGYSQTQDRFNDLINWYL